VLSRVASGTAVSPTQRFGEDAVSGRVGSGSAQRIQSETLEFNAAGAQEPVVRWHGICHHPYVQNVSVGKEFLVRVDVGAGEELEVDMDARTVKLDGQMVWGYTGRWFDVKPGDLIRAGASGIGVGFSVEIDLYDVGGLITKTVAGRGASEHSSLGRPEISTSKVGQGALEAAGRGGRQGVGAGKLVTAAGGDAEKRTGY
jgi:hypothetical protein